VIRLSFARKKVGEHGAYTVWGFMESGVTAWGDSPFAEPHMTGDIVADPEAGNTKPRDPAHDPAHLGRRPAPSMSRLLGVRQVRVSGVELPEFLEHAVDMRRREAKHVGKLR
jgi:hypothetical protein